MNEPEMRRFDSNTGLNPPKERERVHPEIKLLPSFSQI